MRGRTHWDTLFSPKVAGNSRNVGVGLPMFAHVCPLCLMPLRLSPSTVSCSSFSIAFEAVEPCWTCENPQSFAPIFWNSRQFTRDIIEARDAWSYPCLLILMWLMFLYVSVLPLKFRVFSALGWCRDRYRWYSVNCWWLPKCRCKQKASVQAIVDSWTTLQVSNKDLAEAKSVRVKPESFLKDVTI